MDDAEVVAKYILEQIDDQLSHTDAPEADVYRAVIERLETRLEYIDA